MSDTLVAERAELLSPESKLIREGTIRNLGRMARIDTADAMKFSDDLLKGAPALSAKADIIFGAIYGKLTVSDLPSPYQKKVYKSDVWGVGATGGTSIGVMYTAYSDWSAFFKNVTSCHVQGIADGAGILQVNWFISNGTPVGQFNGAMAGAGGLEAGGSGKWTG